MKVYNISCERGVEEYIESADLEISRRIFTSIIRADRFSSDDTIKEEIKGSVFEKLFYK